MIFIESHRNWAILSPSGGPMQEVKSGLVDMGTHMVLLAGAPPHTQERHMGHPGSLSQQLLHMLA